MALIRFKRGPKASMPTLQPGEPGWCMDTGELFIGTASEGNIHVGSNLFDLQEVLERLAALEGYGKVNGANIYIQPTAPSNPGVGDLWYDISNIGV